MSLAPIGMFNRQVDAFGLGDILGDYDRQMRHMMRELNRMESQYEGQLDNTIQSQWPLTSLMDRSAITPRILDQNGQKIAQFNFDIKGFKPQDVHIKTADGRLVVGAKHEDEGEDHHAIREFRRMVTLPEGMQIEGMKSRLHPNGVLSVYAPYTPPAIEHKQNELPIHHERDAKALK